MTFIQAPDQDQHINHEAAMLDSITGISREEHGVAGGIGCMNNRDIADALPVDALADRLTSEGKPGLQAATMEDLAHVRTSLEDRCCYVQ
eukprot:1160686-Pelagomonas_calceolata.AAC.5